MREDEAVVGDRPEGLTQMLDAAEKLLAKMERRLRAPARMRSRDRSTEEVLRLSASELMAYLGYVDDLCRDIDDLNFVRYGPPADDRDVPTAMAQIESHVDAILNRHRVIRSWRTNDRDGAEGRDILAAMYRHLLGELETWLRGIVAALRNPFDALMEQGTLLVPDSVVRLKMKVYFATPPQMSALEAWAKRCLRR